ncbi:peptide MFS transporter [Corynebacterium sp. H113]|uniref:peptide MFS transporter n=1 Tax=Corynebacterium sp. H113 TaxID=3133419 RepID=UPI0030B6A644
MSKLEQRSRVAIADKQRGTPLGSPKIAIPALVGVETWERFSYYGMQAIMAYYLYDTAVNGGLGLPTTTATALMGAYGSLVYLCTIAGGWIGDRLLGAEKTLLAGSWLLVLGHLALSLIPGGAGVAIGLFLVAIGSGSLKTSAITLLGHVRPLTDRRRDSDFQMFYFGINVGALLGPLLTGWISVEYGYRIGFAVAAALMIAGLIHYHALRRPLSASWRADIRDVVEKPANRAPGRTIVLVVVAIAVIIAVLVVLVSAGVLALSDLATVMFGGTLAVTIGLFAQMLNDGSLSATERRRVAAFIPLFIVSVAFWAILNQTFGALAVYADIRTDRMIGDFEAPAAWAQSLNPIFILLLSTPLAAARLKFREKAPSTPTQILFGAALAGVGVMTLIGYTGMDNGTVPLVALVAAYGIITFGELHVGPVGMSTATALAPEKYATRFSALFFMTMSVGTAFAGMMSTSYDPNNHSAELSYFLTIGIGAIALAGLTAVFLPWIKRAMPEEETAEH